MSGSKKYFSTLQESVISKYLGWKQVSGSGNRHFHPGDIVCSKWLGECKTHTQISSVISFKFADWDKIEKEANSQFKLPVLFTDNGSQIVYNTYVMIKIDKNLVPEDYIQGDYSDNKSISFNITELADYKFFKRYNDIYMILPLNQFKRNIEYFE